MDVNASGTVEFEELCSLLKTSGMDDLIPTLKDWMDDYDSNNDGNLTTILVFVGPSLL